MYRRSKYFEGKIFAVNPPKPQISKKIIPFVIFRLYGKSRRLLTPATIFHSSQPSGHDATNNVRQSVAGARNVLGLFKVGSNFSCVSCRHLIINHVSSFET